MYQKTSYYLAILLFFSLFFMLSSAEEIRPNVEFPEVIQGDNFLFAAISSSTNEFLTNGQEIDTKDIWLISFRQANISSIQYFYRIDNQTVPRNSTFGYDSVPDRSWLKLGIPEQAENRTKLEIFYLQQIKENVTLEVGFTFYYITPSSELAANISQGELSLQKMTTGILSGLFAMSGGYLGYFMKRKSPLLDVPGIIVMIIFFMSGVTITIAVIEGLKGIGSFSLYIVLFLSGVTFAVWKYKFPVETMVMAHVITENQSVPMEIYNVKKLGEDYYEVFQPGLPAIMKLFNKDSYIQAVAPISNPWASNFDYFTFIEESEVIKTPFSIRIEFLAQELEVTQEILEANRYLKSVELNAKMFKQLKDKYNNLVVGISRYSDSLVSQRLYEINALLPDTEIKESQKELMSEIENFTIVENWKLREEIQKEKADDQLIEVLEEDEPEREEQTD